MLIEYNDFTEDTFTYKKYIKAGLICLIIGGLLTYFWLIKAQLESASIAQGVISVEGNRKTIAHLEGGIVDKVLVHEGDLVQKGQTLIILSPISAQAKVSQLELRYYSGLAQQNRLESERHADEEVIFSPDVFEAAKRYPSLNAVIKTQQALFASRRKMLVSQLQVLTTRLQGAESDGASYARQLQRQEQAYKFMQEELDMQNKLLQNGYTSKLQAIELKRNLAMLSSDLMQLKGQLDSLDNSKEEIKEQMQAVKHQFVSNVESELQDVSQTVDDAQEQLASARDVLHRLTIVSPHSGRVVGLNVFSHGDVISPGETVMQVVPDNDQLIVEATLRPEDIDVVHQGQKASIRLSAYNYRTTPMFDGEVLTVAADRLPDEERRDQKQGFKIKVAIKPEQLKEYPNVKLYPGMPAEVYVLQTKRSPMDYLLEPLDIGLLRAFREDY